MFMFSGINRRGTQKEGSYVAKFTVIYAVMFTAMCDLLQEQKSPLNSDCSEPSVLFSSHYCLHIWCPRNLFSINFSFFFIGLVRNIVGALTQVCAILRFLNLSQTLNFKIINQQKKNVDLCSTSISVGILVVLSQKNYLQNYLQNFCLFQFTSLPNKIQK